MLPLAHLGHYVVWVLYALPVLVVVGGIVYSSYTARKRAPAEREKPGSPPGG